MNRCLNRRPPTGELTGSWIRDHHCTQPTAHDGPHQCRCGYAWNNHHQDAA